MRYAININNLPPQCDTGKLELLNMHYHALSWPMRNSREYTIDAFSNGVNPFDFAGPFCFDIEPEALWGPLGTEFDKWLGIHTRAITATRRVFENELLAYDACGGNSRDAALRNVLAARKMLLSLDGAGVSTYPLANNTFAADGSHAEFTLEAYRTLRKQSRRLDWQIGTFVHNYAGGSLARLKVFTQSIEWGIKQGVDFICFWQAESYFGGGTSAEAAVRIQPYIDALREVAK